MLRAVDEVPRRTREGRSKVESETASEGRVGEQRDGRRAQKEAAGAREDDDLGEAGSQQATGKGGKKTTHLDEHEEADLEQRELLLDALANDPIDLLAVLALSDLEVPSSSEESGGVAEGDAETSVERIVVQSHARPMVCDGCESTLEQGDGDALWLHGC